MTQSAAPPAVMTFFTAGRPQTKGSMRQWHRWQPEGRCQVGMSEESGPRLKEWRALIATSAKRAMRGALPFSGPVRVELTFLFERSKSNKDRTGFAWGNHRWDIDKLSRAVLDALSDAAVWGDDSQAAVLQASKRYTDGLERAGVHGRVTALGDE